MKGIYLTEEGKKEIEAKIVELKIPYGTSNRLGELTIYKEILSSATILPVEEDCDRILQIVPIEVADRINKLAKRQGYGVCNGMKSSA